MHSQRIGIEGSDQPTGSRRHWPVLMADHHLLPNRNHTSESTNSQKNQPEHEPILYLPIRRVNAG
jgi:hypothetical protein